PSSVSLRLPPSPARGEGKPGSTPKIALRRSIWGALLWLLPLRPCFAGLGGLGPLERFPLLQARPIGGDRGAEALRQAEGLRQKERVADRYVGGREPPGAE